MNAQTYGAVEPDDHDHHQCDHDHDHSHSHDNHYDESHTYYLKDKGGKLTAKKLLIIAVPILAAVLIVGGFGWFLFRDFNHLYPGANGEVSEELTEELHGHKSSSSNSGVITSEPEIVAPPPPHHASSSASSSLHEFHPAPESDGPAACSANKECSTKGLEGDCCPTIQGVMLGCCLN